MKILVVDDAPYVLKVFQDFLGAFGHEVYEAIDGEEALIKYREIDPDVVLMDILMPKLDGVNATKEILKINPLAKIIVITAVGKPGLENDCIMAGAKSFISKPFKIKELMNIINSVMEK